MMMMDIEEDIDDNLELYKILQILQILQIIVAESGDGGDGNKEGDENRDDGDIGGDDGDGDIDDDSQLSKILQKQASISYSCKTDFQTNLPSDVPIIAPL